MSSITIRLWAKGAAGMGGKAIVVAYILGPLFAVGYFWFAIVMARNIESLFTTFQVSPAGITIENWRYGVLSLDWKDLTSATYNKKRIILKSPMLWPPLSILDLGRGRSEGREFVAARNLIRGAIQDRWIIQRGKSRDRARRA
jgi:hypothetical protein